MRPIRAALPLLLICVTPAFAAEMPARKAGLWEMKMTVEGRGIAMPAIQQCIDAATDKQMNTLGASMGPQQCSKKDVQVSGSTVTVDAVCSVGGMTATSHAFITGDFNSAYVVKVNSTRAGGPAAPGVPAEANMTIEAKWLGPCKADQRPGDMIMANGMKVNINDLAKMGAPGMSK
ncbi:MAG TPA: DUF3617 family protein [Xanthobacteraceae bacterium]|nr:DUF3617 family protein [Xanthobacteraceae bacterium]